MITNIMGRKILKEMKNEIKSVSFSRTLVMMGYKFSKFHSLNDYYKIHNTNALFVSFLFRYFRCVFTFYLSFMNAKFK